MNLSERRLVVVIPAAALATVSLGTYLYWSGRLRLTGRFPFVSCSLKRCFARMTLKPAPRLGAPRGGISVDPDSYPWVHRDKSIVESKFGVDIPDPFQWLEDPDAPNTAGFIEAQNLFSEQIFQQCETRERFQSLYKEMDSYERFGCPDEEGGRYYFRYSDGKMDQPVLSFSEKDFENPKVLLDPNHWSSDGKVDLRVTSFSKSGEFMAYSMSSAGSDWETIKVLKVRDQRNNGKYYDDLEDELHFIKFSEISWTHDEKGFFYSSFPAPESGNTALGRGVGINRYHHVRYHVLGTPQSEDRIVLRRDDMPEHQFYTEVTEDGDYLIVYVCLGCHAGNGIAYLDLSQIPKRPDGVMDFSDCQKKIVHLIKKDDDSYSFVANDGSLFTFLTSNNAPRKKLVRVDVMKPNQWKDLLPEHEIAVLDRAMQIKGDLLIVCYLKHCSNTLELRKSSTGELVREIDVPKFGSISQITGHKNSSQFFFSRTSFTEPLTIYKYETTTSELIVVRRSSVPGYNPDLFETKQVFVDSYDKSVKIPLFITHKKDMPLNGSNPTLLYGYGGFGEIIGPDFSLSQAAFAMAYGGVLATAVIRGGGEYGQNWRRAGNLENKQNCFDDFQACAEYLISAKYCNPSKLAINGGSNGGLLVAVCANQRPDLFACVVCDVGLLDMMRFHKFTVGYTWIPELGDPDNIDDFEYLIKYSPLHNVQKPLEGTKQYPSILLKTGDHDDRVSPLHTFKFLAELQSVLCSGADSVQTNPIIARIETKSGHGHGKPVLLIVNEVADTTAFIVGSLRAQWQLY